MKLSGSLWAESLVVNCLIKQQIRVTTCLTIFALCIMMRFTGVISYSITSDNEVNINIGSFLDFDIKNEDSNSADYFWQSVGPQSNEECDRIIAATKKANFWVALSQLTTLNIDNDNFS